MRNSRKTDSLAAAKSAEFLFRLAPRLAAFALAIAVFVSDSTADADTREGVIARIARAAWDCWAGY